VALEKGVPALKGWGRDFALLKRVAGRRASAESLLQVNAQVPRQARMLLTELSAPLGSPGGGPERHRIPPPHPPLGAPPAWKPPEPDGGESRDFYTENRRAQSRECPGGAETLLCDGWVPLETR
jgi:hypothetical protein